VVAVSFSNGSVRAAGLVRTARKIMKGMLYVPGQYQWAGQSSQLQAA